MSVELLKMMNVVPAGKRSIVKSGDRYFVYLPINLNHVWQELHKRGVKVEVYLKISSGDKDE